MTTPRSPPTICAGARLSTCASPAAPRSRTIGSSTARQYHLAERAIHLGWPREQVKVVDEDLGISGSGLSERAGFARMTADVALGQVGIVLGLEVSRLARNGILNRQGRTTATGLSFTANRVGSLRTHWKIPCFEPVEHAHDGDCMTIEQAAQALGVAPSTLHRWLNDGFIAGEQVTLGAPWRIRLTDDLRSKFVENAPEGYVTMLKATHLLGVSRQTILQRVKRGELHAVHINCGRKKGLRIRSAYDSPGSL